MEINPNPTKIYENLRESRKTKENQRRSKKICEHRKKIDANQSKIDKNQRTSTNIKENP